MTSQPLRPKRLEGWSRGIMSWLTLAAAVTVPGPLFCSFSGQAAASQAEGTLWTMPRSEVRDVQSPSGATYRIFVSWPEEPAPPEGYPILYTLDGNESFPVAATVSAALGPYLDLEPGIIVGIGYVGPTRRSYDYTPDVPDDTTMLLPSGPAGGADELLQFIVGQVRPQIETRYPVDRTRQTLSGYSLGGLFVLHALSTRPEAFQTYVAASPSIWFGEKRILAKAEGLNARLQCLPKRRLILSAGEYEQNPPRRPGQSEAQWRKFQALSRKARMIDNARNLKGQLLQIGEDNLSIEFSVMPSETHSTGVFPAMRDALSAAFGPPTNPG